MRIKEFVLLFLISFVLALLVNGAITFLWNYFIKHNGPVIDWGSSFTIALILAIVISLSQIKKQK